MTPKVMTLARPLEAAPPALATLLATPLGQALDADGAEWRVEATHVTAYATHLVLVSGRAELRVALVGDRVVEEDWHGRVLPLELDAEAIQDRLDTLANALSNVVGDIQKLFDTVGTSESASRSGAHALWPVNVRMLLGKIEEDVGEAEERLRAAVEIADEVAELEAENRPS